MRRPEEPRALSSIYRLRLLTRHGAERRAPADPGRRRAALAVVIGAAALLVATLPALADPRIRAKEAQAQRVVAEVQQLNARLARATEAYDGANYRLSQIRAQLVVNRHELDVARANLRVARRRLGGMVRALYESGGQDSTLEVILGSRTLDDVLNRLETASRVSSLDEQVLRQVIARRLAVARRGRKLARARAAQKRVVAQRSAAKARIQQDLLKQRSLLASIHGQIVTLRQEQAAYEAQLAARARARLAAERFQEQQRLRAVVVGVTAQNPAGGSRPSASVVPPSPIGTRVVTGALRLLGAPYVWGAAGPTSFDCSGLVKYVFARVGISLPHFAAAQWSRGVYVPRDELEPGDIVFFAELDHVGIYIGNGDYIQAPDSGDVVKITPLNASWSAANYFGARRIIP
jgi:peptidoglycan DL-endopeptidase CwlO